MNMFGKMGRLVFAVVAMVCTSCSMIHEDADDCDVFLQFIYDYNMEYTCTFASQVGSVDIYVFDENGVFLFTKSALQRELTDGNKMRLTGDLIPGTYKIIVVGGLSDRFTVSSSRDDSSLSGGAATLNDSRLALSRTSDVVDDDFPSIWLGRPITVTHDGNKNTWPVSLVRNTNKFNLTLVRHMTRNAADEDDNSNLLAYTFEIVTPEGAVYSFENEPLSAETVTYKPHTRTSESNVSTGLLKTCRLFDNDGYRLIVRNTNTGAELWNYDLISLLKHSKPSSNPDGTPLPLQEYLDRENDWNLTVLYKGVAGIDDGFTAVSVEINGWILWLNDTEL